jgi:hypothetical protein
VGERPAADLLRSRQPAPGLHVRLVGGQVQHRALAVQLPTARRRSPRWRHPQLRPQHCRLFNEEAILVLNLAGDVRKGGAMGREV